METASTNNGTRHYAGGKMLSAHEDGIGVITFNQPEKLNAMSVEMWAGLGEILDEFREDSSIRVVVLTGAGNKAFISGADISQFEKQRSNADTQKEYDRLTSGGRAQLAAFTKPVISQIRGFCLGGGLAIAMQTDLRIASVNSQFGIPAARLGVAYGIDSIRKLMWLVGPAHASMILFAGQRMDAAEAERIGIINEMVPDEQLTEAVTKVAHTIANNAPLSIAASKLFIDQVMRDPSARDVEAVQKAMSMCFNSADYREGRTAFMEKRQPRFQGK